ncbi:hypothetical protein [Chloroflexus sp.]|uniref:hypothetical protein n=1 Tax=Chloroflexus sp. TaxID=1904827 RepID=UPI002ADD6BBB|nr:hypothetical protein [Chloroflexus sp.]
MQLIGPETERDRELREWFAAQERGNVERLEAGAQTMMQVISGLYGVLFAVLALSDQPTYLQLPVVRWAGSAGVCIFFASLVAAMLVLLPRRIAYQEDNLTAMRRAYDHLLRRKATLLQVAQVLFLGGIACVIAVILAIVWQ